MTKPTQSERILGLSWKLLALFCWLNLEARLEVSHPSCHSEPEKEGNTIEDIAQASEKWSVIELSPESSHA